MIISLLNLVDSSLYLIYLLVQSVFIIKVIVGILQDEFYACSM